MPDDALTTILQRLDSTHQPDPWFASELLTTLRPLALDAGRRDATLLGRLRGSVAGRAAIGEGARPTRLLRLALVAAVAALVIGLLASLIGRAPARPFIHDASFGFFRIVLDGDHATADAMRGVVAASPDGSYILVDRRDPSDPSLGIYDIATGDVQDLPSEPGDVSALWSTDDRLAWAVRPADQDQPASAIQIIRPGQDTVLTWHVPRGQGPAPTGVGSFVWSPDGRQLAVATMTDELADHVYLIDAATAVGRELGDGLKPESYAWSPDGRSIAASLDGTFDPTTNDVALVAIDVTTGVQTELGRVGSDFAWLNDGSVLVSGQDSLWQIDPVRKERRLVATSPDIGGRLFPSPDGSLVAYMGPGDAPSLWTVPSAGGQPRLLADDLWYRWIPSWSPDGRWILFTRGAVSDRSLWMIHPDGTGMQEIVAPGVREIPQPTLLDVP